MTTPTSFYSQPGDIVEFTAPSGGVSRGVPVLIGAIVVIPTDTVAETLKFQGYCSGVHKVPKANSQEWTEGCKVYLDNTNHCFTTSATNNTLAGVAVAAVANTSGLTSGYVRLGLVA